METNPNRRDVMKAGAAAVALAATGGAIIASASADEKPAAGGQAAASGGKARPIKKAVMYGMIGEGKTVLEKFALLKECGFDGVEMDSPSGLDREEVKKAAAD